MYGLQILGAALLTAEQVTSFTTQLTTVVSDNLPAVVGIVAVVWGINFARRMINRGLKGRV
ncbi:MAG: hypothetical protein ACOX0Z_02625 [Candidatus Nanosyncoccaceae bacterium]|jgi:hypothetical protein